MAFPTGAAITAGASLIGGLFGNRSRKRESARQREWAEDMWNRQNAYNTPANQMQRLKDAGLNPALMYGQGNVGNAEKAMGYQQPQIENVGAGVAQGVAAGAQLDLVNSQKKLNEANATARVIEAYLKGGGTKQKATEMFEHQMDNLIADTNLKGGQLLNIDADTKLKMEQKGLTTEKILTEAKQRKLFDSNIDLNKAQEALRNYDIGQREKGIYDNSLQTIMNAYGVDLNNKLDRQIAQGVITTLIASQILKSLK